MVLVGVLEAHYLVGSRNLALADLVRILYVERLLEIVVVLIDRVEVLARVEPALQVLFLLHF